MSWQFLPLLGAISLLGHFLISLIASKKQKEPFKFIFNEMQTSGHAFFNLAVRYEDETAANYGHMHTVAPMILPCSPVWQDRVHTTGSEQSVKRKPSDAVLMLRGANTATPVQRLGKEDKILCLAKYKK